VSVDSLHLSDDHLTLVCHDDVSDGRDAPLARAVDNFSERARHLIVATWTHVIVNQEIIIVGQKFRRVDDMHR
jgi:hypothetical protein